VTAGNIAERSGVEPERLKPLEADRGATIAAEGPIGVLKLARVLNRPSAASFGRDVHAASTSSNVAQANRGRGASRTQNRENTIPSLWPDRPRVRSSFSPIGPRSFAYL